MHFHFFSKEKTLKPLKFQRLQGFQIWQGHKDSNPGHVVLECTCKRLDFNGLLPGWPLWWPLSFLYFILSHYTIIIMYRSGILWPIFLFYETICIFILSNLLVAIHICIYNGREILFVKLFLWIWDLSIYSSTIILKSIRRKDPRNNPRIFISSNWCTRL